jgi:hypothetical protein
MTTFCLVHGAWHDDACWGPLVDAPPASAADGARQAVSATTPPTVSSASLYARDDELFRDRWSRWIARTLVGVEPLELPGGHFPMLEPPLTIG